MTAPDPLQSATENESLAHPKALKHLDTSSSIRSTDLQSLKETAMTASRSLLIAFAATSTGAAAILSPKIPSGKHDSLTTHC